MEQKEKNSSKVSIKRKLYDFFGNEIYCKNCFIFVLLPLLLDFFIEVLHRGSLVLGFKFVVTHPVQFLCNVLVIAVSLSVALLLKRRFFYVCLISGVWLALGITNRVLLSKRVSPFNASDLQLIDAAISLMDQYVSPLTVTLALIGIALVVILLGVLFVKGRKVQYKINYWKNATIICITFIGCICATNVALETGYLVQKFPNLTIGYNEYGVVYCFGSGLFNSGVEKPAGYSKDKIDEIKEKNEIIGDGSEDLKKPEKTPNIIFLQLESFMDLNKVKNLKFNQDPTPYFNKLKEEYTSGYLNVYNVGYGTCNTEFEIMTSMNLEDFGPGEIPYKSVLKDTTCESIAFDLKKYGYSTHVMHNNDATFYSRKTVFPHLGYDTFTSIEYMNVEEYTYEGWAKDKVFTGEIEKVLNSTDDQDYIYAISVQGHGSYPAEKVLEEPVIKVESGFSDEGRNNMIEYYANQIYEMDEFIKELTDMLSKRDEDTILVMYGDHLPGLGFSEKDLVNASLYQTEYVIWSNFEMEKQDEDIETFQLAPKVMASVGMNSGVINQYHQSFLNLSEEERKDELKDYLSGLQSLEYDILFGDMLVYDEVSPYEATDMVMGVEEITINNVEKVEDETGKYIKISGENFTKSSRVFINGVMTETEFVNADTLKIKYYDLKSLDSFIVSQVDKDSDYIVGSTKEFLYYDVEEKVE